MAVRFDLEHEMGEPEGLHGLPEALRRPVGHLVEDPAHLQELRPAGFVRLLLRRPEGEVGVPPGEGAHRVHHDDDRAVEIALVDIAVVGQVERGELFLRAALIVPEARPQHVAVIDRAVRVARGDVALRLDDAEVIVEPRVGREGRETPVEHRVVLPEGRDLPQLPLILLRDVKDVAVPALELVELVDHPRHRVLGEDRRAAVARRLVSGDQRLRLDEDRHARKHLAQHGRALEGERLVLPLAVDAGGDHRALDTDLRLRVQQLLAEGRHARGKLSKITHIGFSFQ